MIKPGTICMIRRVPQDYPGHSLNGSVVKAVAVKRVVEDHTIWHIDPPLQAEGRNFNGCAERWLHPLDPCEDDMARETLERLDEQMRQTFVDTVLDKLFES